VKVLHLALYCLWNKSKNGRRSYSIRPRFRKNLRVLVAEDALNQLLIKIILNDFGFEHEIVSNGKLAIEKMQTNTYDIILMDLQMPEMNGFIGNRIHT
jgi:PleD family two-component response regulator